ncbi:MAG: hypothetical protein P9M15_04980 [Candidatus Electryoneaceae bacterium]|nr:hypothetical protein [Candidatus Electryoneaceae bacterium]
MHIIRLPLVVLVMLVLFSVGCEDQPTEYIFEPTHRDQVLVVRTATDFLKTLYEHTDQAGTFLDEAALTDYYSSVLPEGWLVATDMRGIPIVGSAGDTLYIKNYLDQKFHLISFDSDPMGGAVRSPSSLNFDYLEVGSYRDGFTNSFYGDTSESLKLSIEYTDDRQNPGYLDGWFQIQRSVEFEGESGYSAGGERGSYTYNYYLQVKWFMRIEDFSLDPDNHSARIIIDGVFPILDEMDKLQEPQISGEIVLDKNGIGTGEMWLYGDRVARLHFTGRSFGFTGYFTLDSEDHHKRYRLTQ